MDSVTGSVNDFYSRSIADGLTRRRFALISMMPGYYAIPWTFFVKSSRYSPKGFLEAKKIFKHFSTRLSEGSSKQMCRNYSWNFSKYRFTNYSRYNWRLYVYFFIWILRILLNKISNNFLGKISSNLWVNLRWNIWR